MGIDQVDLAVAVGDDAVDAAVFDENDKFIHKLVSFSTSYLLCNDPGTRELWDPERLTDYYRQLRERVNSEITKCASCGNRKLRAEVSPRLPAGAGVQGLTARLGIGPSECEISHFPE